MSISRFLSDGGWRDIVAKNKVKDNGLLKALVELKKCGENHHVDALNILDELVKLAGQLKKDKAIAAVPQVGRYLSEVTGAAELAEREVAKARAEAEKKARAEAGKKGGDDEDVEPPAVLTTQMLPLLRRVAKGETMHTVVASAGRQVVVMLSRKPIPPARRKLLAEQLRGSGSIKYHTGHCTLEENATTFVLNTEVAGMAKRIRGALLEQTGLRVNKLRCRGDDGQPDNDLA